MIISFYRPTPANCFTAQMEACIYSRASHSWQCGMQTLKVKYRCYDVKTVTFLQSVEFFLFAFLSFQLKFFQIAPLMVSSLDEF